MTEFISPSGVFLPILKFIYEGTESKMKENGILYTVKRLGISLGCGVFSLAVFLAVCSAIALGTGDPDPLLLPLSLTSLALSFIVTGIVSARLGSDSIGTLLSSLSASCTYVLSIFLTGLFFPSSDTVFGIGIKMLIYSGMILTGLLGGVIGRPRTKKRPVHHRRNRR